MAAAAVTIFLSTATVGGVVASQGVFDGSSTGTDDAAPTTLQVLDGPATVGGLPLEGATVVVVDREPIVMTRDVVVPDARQAAATGHRDDDDHEWDDDDRDDDDHEWDDDWDDDDRDDDDHEWDDDRDDDDHEDDDDERTAAPRTVRPHAGGGSGIGRGHVRRPLGLDRPGKPGGRSGPRHGGL